MEPLFLGAHPAADFLNTTLIQNETLVELIGDGRSFVDWLVVAGLLDASSAKKLERSVGIKALDAAAAEARNVRKWVAAWVLRWSEAPDAKYDKEIDQLNKLLARGRSSREVVFTLDGLQLVERFRIESANELIALVAHHVALLITQEDPGLLKQCSGPSCTLMFVDKTKAHRRLFCSASLCGNRAKVAAFRERQRLT